MTATTAAPLLPPAQAWHTASYDRPCPTGCGVEIKRGHPVAHVHSLDGPRHVCARCTCSPRGETR